MNNDTKRALHHVGLIMIVFNQLLYAVFAITNIVRMEDQAEALAVTIVVTMAWLGGTLTFWAYFYLTFVKNEELQ